MTSDELQVSPGEAPEPRKSSNHADVPFQLDLLLSRYVSVWLWSIVFGSLSGITFSYLTISGRGDNPIASFVLSSMAIFGTIFSALSWYQLFKYLYNYIIPQFIVRVNADASDEVNRANAYTLASAFRLLVFFRIIADGYGSHRAALECVVLVLGDGIGAWSSDEFRSEGARERSFSAYAYGTLVPNPV